MLTVRILIVKLITFNNYWDFIAFIYKNLLIFEKTDKVDDGVIGCFCDEDNVATCKKYKELNGIVMLQPMNIEFEPIIIDPLKDNFRCLGRLKKVIKDFDWED